MRPVAHDLQERHRKRRIVGNAFAKIHELVQIRVSNAQDLQTQAPSSAHNGMPGRPAACLPACSLARSLTPSTLRTPVPGSGKSLREGGVRMPRQSCAAAGGGRSTSGKATRGTGGRRKFEPHRDLSILEPRRCLSAGMGLSPGRACSALVERLLFPPLGGPHHPQVEGSLRASNLRCSISKSWHILHLVASKANRDIARRMNE